MGKRALRRQYCAENQCAIYILFGGLITVSPLSWHRNMNRTDNRLPQVGDAGEFGSPLKISSSKRLALCSYRNYLMCLTALRSGSEVSFADGKPSIRAIQRWMKEAWDAGKSAYGARRNTWTLNSGKGYDPQGQRDFKGVIVNTKKWIGTAGQ
jgi:hypothetical protein